MKALSQEQSYRRPFLRADNTCLQGEPVIGPADSQTILRINLTSQGIPVPTQILQEEGGSLSLGERSIHGERLGLHSTKSSERPQEILSLWWGVCKNERSAHSLVSAQPWLADLPPEEDMRPGMRRGQQCGGAGGEGAHSVNGCSRVPVGGWSHPVLSIPLRGREPRCPSTAVPSSPQT